MAIRGTQFLVLYLSLLSAISAGDAKPGYWDDLHVLKSIAAQFVHHILDVDEEKVPYWRDSMNEGRLRVSASKYCDADLGCFGAGDQDFWHPLYRPINLLPRSREDLQTAYMLYTRKNPREWFVLKPGRKRKPLPDIGPFNLAKDLKVIIPGWIDSRFFIRWMDELKDGLLLNGDYNVIIVDWSQGNKPPYTQAAANARVIGAELALLLDNLKNSGANVGKMHIIGHSLGSHIAGYAGQRLPGLGRITGLDPAGPYFQGMPASTRLDPTDARLVDVWHTDGGPLMKLGLGMDDPVGHVDFYPNGGKDQPGCASQKISTVITEGLIMGVRRFLGCNHERAIQLYLQAVNAYKGDPGEICHAWAYPCPDWDTFFKGQCSSCGSKSQPCAAMDIDVLNPDRIDDFKEAFVKNGNKSSRFYLQTNSNAPYCLYHYQVSVHLSRSTVSKSQRGRMSLRLENSPSKNVKVELTSSNTDLHPGATYRYLITSGNNWPLGTSKVWLEWKSDRFLGFIFQPKIYLRSLDIKPMKENLWKESRVGRQGNEEVWSYSTTGDEPVYSGKPVLLLPL